MAKQKEALTKAQKESKKRVDTLEKHIWKGIQDGVAATKNKATIPELIDVLTRYTYQYNKRNLDFVNNGGEENVQPSKN